MSIFSKDNALVVYVYVILSFPFLLASFQAVPEVKAEEQHREKHLQVKLHCLFALPSAAEDLLELLQERAFGLRLLLRLPFFKSRFVFSLNLRSEPLPDLSNISPREALPPVPGLRLEALDFGLELPFHLREPFLERQQLPLELGTFFLLLAQLLAGCLELEGHLVHRE